MLTSMIGGVLRIDEIRAALRTGRIGRQIVHVDSTVSTNDEAWARAGEADADGLVVLAEYQSAGRGRFGRPWLAPRGASLLMSVLLIDRDRRLDGGRLGLMAGVAVHEVVASHTITRPTIKWPNDVLVAGRKIAGAIVEARRLADSSTAMVLGIGLNCLQHAAHFPPELRTVATSIELQSERSVDRTDIAIELMRGLDQWLASPDDGMDERLRSAWLARAVPLGERIRLRHNGKLYVGHVADIDPAAALVVRLDDGGLRLFKAADTTVVCEQDAAES